MDKKKQHNPNKSKIPRIMIIAGEASGDLHGGALAEALFASNRDIEILGFGGGAMRSAGVDIRFDIKKLGIVGLIEVLFHWRVILEAYRTAVTVLKEAVNLLVLIDFSGFNLRVAKAANRLGIPVVYYVSPQVWAWRKGRVKTIAERVDQMLVILPFEKEIYDEAHVPCEFVGHPLLDEFDRLGYSSSCFPEENPKERKFPSIALLPGSRTREVTSLLPTMLAGLERLLPEFPDLQVSIPIAPSLPEKLVSEMTASSPLSIRLIQGTVYDIFRDADIAVVASGTATLQGALVGTPMVVVYKIAWASYWIARVLVKIKSAGMANIIADQPFIPELLQKDFSPEKLAGTLCQLLNDAPARESMRRKLKEVAGRLGTPGASLRAATAIFKVLDRSLMEHRSGGKPHPLIRQTSA